MTNTRRVVPIIAYLGVDITTDVATDLVSFKYADNEGKSDEIQIELQDRDRKWQDPWLPQKGDRLTAAIRLENWRKEGEVSQLNCGTFYIDDVSFKGPPDAISIKALSIPFTSGGKNTKNSRAWENSDLAGILGDIATSAGLTLLYDAPNFTYERVDQVRETDLTFAKRMARKEGLSIKVTDKQLVIYDELTYERKDAVRKIIRGESDVKSYSFSESAAEEQYKKVEVAYFDNKKKKTIKYTYDVPGITSGATFKIKKTANNLGEAMRWAKAEARNKNKRSKTGKLTLIGDENLVQGITVELEKFGAFSGKYFIESANHNITGGYSVDIDIREVLPY